MHADPLRQRAAMVHLVHVALNTGVRPGPVLVPGDGVVSDNHSCCSFPLSANCKKKHEKCYKLICSMEVNSLILNTNKFAGYK